MMAWKSLVVQACLVAGTACSSTTVVSGGGSATDSGGDTGSGGSGNIGDAGPDASATVDSGDAGIEQDAADGSDNCTNCPARPNATARCVSGRCRMECNEDYGDCDGLEQNGCEVDLRAGQVEGNTVQHCGACGPSNTCGSLVGRHATASCVNGKCAPACDEASDTADWRNCGEDYSTGCSVNVLTDVNNCGGCGNICNYTHASWCPNERDSCQNGICYGEFKYGESLYWCPIEVPNGVIETPDCEGGCYYQCQSGSYDCDFDGKNGCESTDSNCRPFPYLIF